MVDTPPDHGRAMEEAQQARAQSEAAVTDALEKRREIHAVAEGLRRQRQANRFAERMGESFKSRRP